MVIYLKHPTHGRKVACSEQEAKFDESKGWVRYDIAALLKPPVASVNALAPVMADTSKIDQELSLEALRKEYEAKFGKKPHHKKSVETIRAELNGNSTGSN